MKSIAAYFLIILYTLTLCKPILTLVQNEIAHTFWKAEHLATVRNHHGNYHIEEEVAEAAHEKENDKNHSSVKASEPVAVHIPVQSIYDTHYYLPRNHSVS